MAKINGSCAGTSAAKYDVWIEIKQNSQNITNNTSNVTAALKLQRNDGYASSAYNLTAGENSFSLSVGGTVRDSGTTKIDTRNSAVVTLATWTGDVAHNDDGSLTLAVKGSFTMGNTSLKSGSVSGSFRCSTIARASQLSLGDTTSINPGNSFSFSIVGVSSFSHKITCQIGNNTKQVTSYDKGVMTGTVTIPQSWASFVTEKRKDVLNIVLGTYSGTKLIGSKRYTINFVVPNSADYRPDFNVILNRIDNGVPADWEAFVSGVSQFTVKYSDAQYKFGAAFKSLSIKYNGISKNINGSRFDVLGSGEQNIVVRLTDTRGLYTEKTLSIDVLEYNAPRIKLSPLKRCDEQGVANISGKYLLVDFSSSFTQIKDNTATVVLKYCQQGSTTEAEYTVTTESPVIIGEGLISEGAAYTVTMIITDSVSDPVTVVRSIGTAGIPFNIKRGGNGAAFGEFALNDNELSVAWNLRVKGSLVCESVNVAETELVSEIFSKVQYYKCLGIAFIRIRVKLAQTLKAGSTNVLAVCSEQTPFIITPLSVYRYGGSVTEGSVIACIRSGTGEIEIKTTSDIPAEQYIYVGGSYFTDYVNTEE